MRGRVIYYSNFSLIFMQDSGRKRRTIDYENSRPIAKDFSLNARAKYLAGNLSDQIL
jgi:hypothetical protein